MEPLAMERAFFEQSLDDWLARYPEMFALVKGEELIGTFDTIENALTEGVRRFGNTPFLVRRIVAHAPVNLSPAYDLGILHAHPAFTITGK